MGQIFFYASSNYRTSKQQQYFQTNQILRHDGQLGAQQCIATELLDVD
jgi:hypothetical protein